MVETTLGVAVEGQNEDDDAPDVRAYVSLYLLGSRAFRIEVTPEITPHRDANAG
ncbi:hypothetical protein V5O48_010901, partial [Marasmius crinis-equi]